MRIEWRWFGELAVGAAIAVSLFACSSPSGTADAAQTSDTSSEPDTALVDASDDALTADAANNGCPTACSVNPCANGGTCVPSGTTYSCTCPTGYSGTNCGTSARPFAECNHSAFQFPNQMTVTGGGSAPGGAAITAYSWRANMVPNGSSVTVATPTAPSFSFTPDVAGTYQFCLTVSTAMYQSPERCCRYESAPSFSWSQVTAQGADWGEGFWDSTSIEFLEFRAGQAFIFFATNQRIDNLGSGVITTSDPAWSFGQGVGGSTSMFQFSWQPALTAQSDRSAVSVGDTISASAVGDASVTGEQDVTMNASITLTVPAAVSSAAPVIAEIEFGPLSGSAPGLVKVKFEVGKPIADVVEIGGWETSPTNVSVNDLGIGADQVACDGWFSGTVTLTTGTYDVLARPRNGAISKFGAFTRKSVVVF